MKKTKQLFIALIGTLGLLLSFQQPLPQIFLIGDSISMRYEPLLKEYLKGTAHLESRKDHAIAEEDLDVPKGRNGGDSGMVLKFLKSALKDPRFTPDYLLLNCGLHDIKRSVKTQLSYQVDSASYRSNLEKIYNLLNERNIQLIWVRSTPVIDSVHNKRSKSFKRFSADIERYNAIADDVCRKHNIPNIDLFTFSKSLGRDAVIDHVHFSKPTSKKQAFYISEKIKTILNSGS